MAEISGVFATSHSPGLTGFPERADANLRERVMAAFEAVSVRVRQIRPDVIVAVSVEHFTNFFLSNMPAFAIVTSESHLGPVTAQMGEFLRISQRRYPGSSQLGEHIYRHALAHDFDPALVAGGFDFDENFCVPLELIAPDSAVPIVPIVVNGVNPPYPTPARCYDFGAMLGDAIVAFGQAERVVLLATGGLSHWVGMPQSGSINSEFDTEFLGRLESGDRDKLVDYDDVQLDAAGNGAHEIRTWLVAAGAAGVPFETWVYEPVPQWLTGTAVSAARL
jgi:aromatic ring-opening dioxygenase catalytic subunit (LigB family)